MAGETRYLWKPELMQRKTKLSFNDFLQNETK
ncbi:uncharacterized protein G2W53_009388 [Senna tora]|uniref:Uncharacterized protein n=1 Tax=Senna tora TaxID=362788 RepID=A0A834WYC3_9FABA|nr:uncharacterized protein G2W53_009388 [Senna tora]